MLFRVMMSQMTKGAPISEVTAFIGSTLLPKSPLEIRSQKIRIIAPMTQTAGISTLWSLVPKRILERCGTAIPMKAIGPQKAVMTPVRRAVMPIKINLANFICTPMLLA